MARPGWSRLAILALAVCASFVFLSGGWRLGVGGFLVVLLIFALQFYRDPERTIPSGLLPADVLSPADGRVVDVHLDAGQLCISIFLSPVNVHVNRAPVSGRVLELVHTPGLFLPAYQGRASTENERVRLSIEAPGLGTVTCIQVAGLLARRIENWIETGQTLTRGERYGMIHFGSRVDLVLPSGLAPRVRTGDRVKGGLSVLAGRDTG